ncbi:MAG: hypothetical protein OXJ52_04815 [Oligoflexia bacterium]|nr:hypothetical protein [Oligoflexia bacterium]
MDSETQRKIYLKIQELLAFFHRRETNCHIHLMSFLNKKASLSDKRALRERLIYQIRSHKNYKSAGYNWKELLKLKTKPLLPLASISISYCRYLGVFVIVFDKKVSIGFDIEHKSRVTSQIAQRISSHKALNQSPHPALLWVAKEASVKSLSAPNQPVLFKNCILSNWRPALSSQNYFFDFFVNSSRKYKGIAGFLDGLAIAYTEKLC